MKFSISVLTYCALDHAKQCVESVLKYSTDYELFLVSNGSPLAARYFNNIAGNNRNVRVIENSTNEGFIRPNLRVLEMVNSQLHVLLNDDCQIGPNWLQTLEAPFLQFPKAALSGPAGNCCSLRPNFHGYQGRLFEYLEGSCLMCKTEIVKKHGLFPDYLVGAYAEDGDLSLRMRELGYTIHQVPLRTKHAGSMTSRHVPEVKGWLDNNCREVQKRWAHYIKVRRMDYPIVLRRWNALGDVLLTTPIIRALKQQKPMSPIYVETFAPEIFNGNPNVYRAAQQIPPMKDELRFNLDGAYENRPLKHIVESYSEVVGIKIPDNKPELFFNGKDEQWAAGELPEHTDGMKWCAVHIGPTTWPGKNWPLERFYELCMELGQYKIVLVGHRGETFNNHQNVDLRGRTSISQLAAVLKRCALCVTVDSLPLHVSQSVGTPTIGLFGATLPQFIMTDGSKHIGVCADPKIPCAGERHRVAGKTYVGCQGLCMQSIQVEQVIEAVKEITR